MGTVDDLHTLPRIEPLPPVRANALVPVVHGPQALGAWIFPSVHHDLLVEGVESPCIVAAGELLEHLVDQGDLGVGVHECGSDGFEGRPINSGSAIVHHMACDPLTYSGVNASMWTSLRETIGRD